MRLALGGCIALPAEVRRLFTIEVDVDLLPAQGPEAAAVQAAALCPGDAGLGAVELRVDDALTGKALRRSIDLLSAPPRARPRLLALALAELLFASWSELELQPQGPAPTRPPIVPLPGAAPGTPPAAAPPDRAAVTATPGGAVPALRAPGPAAPSPAPDRRDAARAARSLVARRFPALAAPSGLRLTARAAAQAFLQAPRLLAGAALQLGGDHGLRLGWSFDAAYLYSQSASGLGSLTAETMTAGLSLLLQHPLRRGPLTAWLRAGGGVRAGALRLAGAPQDSALAQGGTLWAPYAGPTGVLSGSLALPRRLVLDLMVEGGYLLTPAHGLIDGAQAVSLVGPWLGLQLGIGVMP